MILILSCVFGPPQGRGFIVPINTNPLGRPTRQSKPWGLGAGIFCGVLVLLLSFYPHGWAQQSAPNIADLAPGEYSLLVENDRISVHANAADLREVLEAIGRQGAVKVTIDPKVGGTATTSFTNLPLKEGLRRLLAGSYVLVFKRESTTGRERLLRVAVLQEGPTQASTPEPAASPAAAIGGVLGKEEKDAEYVPDEVFVKLKADAPEGAIHKVVSRLDATILKSYASIDFFLLKLPSGTTVAQAITGLESDPLVGVVEPNFIVYPDATLPNDLVDGLWGLHNTGQLVTGFPDGGVPDADIDAPEAWDIQTGSASVVVAVIDSGVDYNHLDLAANMWVNVGEEVPPGNGIDDDGNGYVDDYRGWDFRNNDNDPFDDLGDIGHGTLVAGIIGAVGDNGMFVVGVNWTVRIMPLKFLGADGTGDIAHAVEAILYAVANGANVMNNSWGGGATSAALLAAVQAANTAGVLFVASAGNTGSDNDTTPHYPSNLDVANVVAVAASTASDALLDSPPFISNFGANTVDLAAPGGAILSTSPSRVEGGEEVPGSLAEVNGTSYAAAHVSGGAALLMAQFPSFTHLQIRTLLLDWVDLKPAFSGKMVTGGRLNVFTPLNSANGGQPVVGNPGDQTNNEGDTVSLQIVASDTDGDGLTYSATGLPPDLLIDLGTGEISGDIGSGAAGVYAVEVTVTDDGSPNLSTSVSFTWTVNGDADPLTVTIDIKPGSDPNKIKFHRGGVKGSVKVAVLTTEDFDVSVVNEATITFAGASPKHCMLKDVDLDGDDDLLCMFQGKDIVDLDESSTEATLTGETSDGTPISGTDSVLIVPPKG